MAATVFNWFDDIRNQPIEQQLALLSQITQSFASSPDIDETLQTALTHFLKYLNAEADAIFLLE